MASSASRRSTWACAPASAAPREPMPCGWRCRPAESNAGQQRHHDAIQLLRVGQFDCALRRDAGAGRHRSGNPEPRSGKGGEGVEASARPSPRGDAGTLVRAMRRHGSLRRLAKAHDVAIVEDAAQAFGAAWKGKKAGTLGKAAGFSFYPTKNLSACGDGGCVTTNDEDLADHVRRLRNHGSDDATTTKRLAGTAGWTPCRPPYSE